MGSDPGEVSEAKNRATRPGPVRSGSSSPISSARNCAAERSESGSHARVTAGGGAASATNACKPDRADAVRPWCDDNACQEPCAEPTSSRSEAMGRKAIGGVHESCNRPNKRGACSYLPTGTTHTDSLLAPQPRVGPERESPSMLERIFPMSSYSRTSTKTPQDAT